jgi:hypothetical protein
MSSYGETDALVPRGVSVPRRPGVTLVSVPVAGPSVSAPSPRSSPPSVTSSPPAAAASHPVQPTPAGTDALSPPGVVVPQRPGIAIIQTPVPSAPSAPAVVQAQGPLLTDAVVPPGARVLRQPGIVLISIPVTGSAVTGATQSQSGSGVAQPGHDYVLEPRGVNLPSRPGTVLIPTPVGGHASGGGPALRPPTTSTRVLTYAPPPGGELYIEPPVEPSNMSLWEAVRTVLGGTAKDPYASWEEQFIKNHWNGHAFTAGQLAAAFSLPTPADLLRRAWSIEADIAKPTTSPSVLRR